MRAVWGLPILGCVFVGCQNEKTASKPEPEVHNAFTNYVENQVTAMHKADSTATKANQVIQQQQQQTQSSTQEP